MCSEATDRQTDRQTDIVFVHQIGLDATWLPRKQEENVERNTNNIIFIRFDWIRNHSDVRQSDFEIGLEENRKNDVRITFLGFFFHFVKLQQQQQHLFDAHRVMFRKSIHTNMRRFIFVAEMACGIGLKSCPCWLVAGL